MPSRNNGKHRALRQLQLAERDSRADDLRHYRSVRLGLLAGAGTILFGLAYMYAGVLHILLTGKIAGIEWLAARFTLMLIAVLGAVSQWFVIQYAITIAYRVRNTVWRLEQLHRILGGDPDIKYPWPDNIAKHRKRLYEDEEYFRSHQYMTLAPAYIVVAFWCILLAVSIIQFFLELS